MGKLKMNLQKS